MAKQVAVTERKNSPVIIMVPLRVRTAVEERAHEARCSISELGRRALVAYLARPTEE